MDIVGGLPQEISQHILSFLRPEELIVCFYVCKKWYDLANTNFLWKRHCIMELRLDFDADSRYFSRSGTLCKWGTIYRSCKRKVNKWEQDYAQYYNVNLTTCNFSIAYGEISFAVFYFKTVETLLETLHIYQLCEENVNCEQIIELELPGRGMVHLLTDDMYTLVSRNNFVLCFKKISGKHSSYVAICLRSGILEYATKDLMSFINSRNSSVDQEMIIQELCNGYLWLEDSTNFIHIFNLETNVFVSIEAFPSIKSMSNLVVMWTDYTAVIFSPNGNELQRIPIDFAQDIFFNKNILASLHSEAENHTRLLQTFDIKTGYKLMEKNVMRYSDITLHSSCDSIYILERSSRDLYRVSSLCTRSGNIQWSISLPNAFYNLWPAFIQVVSYKHLFVWPSNNRTDTYSIFNLKTGKMLYLSSKILGNIKCISGDVCISMEGKVVHIKSFL